MLKSDHWVKNDSPTTNVPPPPVVYAPLQQQQQHGTPLMYSTAPVTIHHSPHSTYNNNPGPDTYLPFLDRPPPYSSSLDNTTTAYNVTAPTEELAKLQTQHVSSGSSSWFGKKKKSIVKPQAESLVSSTNVRTLNAGAPESRALLGRTIAKRDTSKSETRMVELNPILETFDNIEDGLTESLEREKDHSSPSYNLLKCCRVSVRMVKRVLIALVAISAVYTAGMQVYEHVPVGEIFSNIFSSVVDDKTPLNLTETTSQEPTVFNSLRENSEGDRGNNRDGSSAVVSSTTTALPSTFSSEGVETNGRSATSDVADNRADKTTATPNAGVETVSDSGETTTSGSDPRSHTTTTIVSYPGDESTFSPTAVVDTDPASGPTTTAGDQRSPSTAAATIGIATSGNSVNISSDKTPPSPTLDAVTAGVPTTRNSAAPTLVDTVTSSTTAVVNSDNTSVAGTVFVPATIASDSTTSSTPVSAPSTTARAATDRSIIPIRAETLVNDSDDTTDTDYGTPSDVSDAPIDKSSSVVVNDSTDDADNERPTVDAFVESTDTVVTSNA